MFPNSTILKSLIPYLNEIDSWGYGSLSFDARYKWANIMATFHEHFQNRKTDLRIVDIGGGLGPLDLYFSQFGTVINFDLNHDGTWFDTDSSGILIGARGPNHLAENIIRVSGDFLVEVAAIESETCDFVYDSCSAIHISRSFSNKIAPGLKVRPSDLALSLTFNQINRVLKTSGIFGFATDVVRPGSFELKDMMYAERYVSLARLSGLEYNYEKAAFLPQDLRKNISNDVESF